MDGWIDWHRVNILVLGVYVFVSVSNEGCALFTLLRMWTCACEVTG